VHAKNIKQFRDKTFPNKDKIPTFDLNAFIPMLSAGAATQGSSTAGQGAILVWLMQLGGAWARSRTLRPRANSLLKRCL
jgi:hypothetical protein